MEGGGQSVAAEHERELIRAVVGLGNPGPACYHHRHSIGFRVVDALAQRYGACWHPAKDALVAEVSVGGANIVLVKPMTMMNASGRIVPLLSRRGIGQAGTLVVHDELELAFGKVAFKVGGSARGHNGLRSLIAAFGSEFARVRCGIGRPDDKEYVPAYVLQNFSETPSEVDGLVERAVTLVEECVIRSCHEIQNCPPEVH